MHNQNQEMSLQNQGKRIGNKESVMRPESLDGKLNSYNTSDLLLGA